MAHVLDAAPTPTNVVAFVPDSMAQTVESFAATAIIGLKTTNNRRRTLLISIRRYFPGTMIGFPFQVVPVEEEEGLIEECEK